MGAMTKSNRIFENDHLIGGIAIKKEGLKYTGCLIIGKLKKAGSQQVKSPYNKAQTLALNQYRKHLVIQFDKGHVSNRQKKELLLKNYRQKKSLWVDQLKKQAAIDAKKKPVDITAKMKAVFARVLKKKNKI